MSATRFFPAIILLGLLSGCVAASETLSDSGLMPELALDSSSSWESIYIGRTSREEVQNLFGKPTDIQVSSAGGVTHESWAYVSAPAVRQPYQYLLFFGALAMITSGDQEPFAVSFSQEGIVDGLTVSQFQAQGDDTYRILSVDAETTRPLYGMKNPLAQNFSPNTVSALEN